MNEQWTDDHDLDWWRTFQTRCFNNVPVGRPLAGDHFKIVVEDPLTGEWEDVWTPKPQQDPLAHSLIAEIPQ